MRLSFRGADADAPVTLPRHLGEPDDDDLGDEGAFGEPPGVGEAVQLRLLLVVAPPPQPRDPHELGLPGLLPGPLQHCSLSRILRSLRLLRRAMRAARLPPDDGAGGGDIPCVIWDACMMMFNGLRNTRFNKSIEM